MADSMTRNKLVTEMQSCPVCHTNGDSNLGDHIMGG